MSSNDQLKARLVHHVNTQSRLLHFLFSDQERKDFFSFVFLYNQRALLKLITRRASMWKAISELIDRGVKPETSVLSKQNHLDWIENETPVKINSLMSTTGWTRQINSSYLHHLENATYVRTTIHSIIFAFVVTEYVCVCGTIWENESIRERAL